MKKVNKTLIGVTLVLAIPAVLLFAAIGYVVLVAASAGIP